MKADRGRPRLLGSDALRVVALVGVVMIHAAPWGPFGDQNFKAVELVSRFSVPVFMVLTGLVLGYQYAERPLGSRFARRRLGRTLLPWLVWVPLYILFDLFAIHSVGRNPSDVYSWLNQGGGHLWYLLLVPQLYLLFAVWPKRRGWLLVLPAFVVQVGLCVIRVYGPLPGTLLQQIVLTHGHLLFPFWIGYFALGVAMGRSAGPRPAVTHRPSLLAAATVAMAAGGYLLLNLTFAGAQYTGSLRGTGAFLDPVLPLMVAAIIAWVLLAAPPLLRASAGLARACRALSDLSLGVYIIHPIPLIGLALLLRPYLSHESIFAFVPYCALVVLSVAAGVIATRLIAATPLALTVGMGRRAS